MQENVSLQDDATNITSTSAMSTSKSESSSIMSDSVQDAEKTVLLEKTLVQNDVSLTASTENDVDRVSVQPKDNVNETLAKTILQDDVTNVTSTNTMSTSKPEPSPIMSEPAQDMEKTVLLEKTLVQNDVTLTASIESNHPKDNTNDMLEKTILQDDDATRISPVESIKKEAMANATMVLQDDDATVAADKINYSKGPQGELTIGSIIKDYEIVSILGEGGMGTVFKAKNLVWAAVEARDPYVAIKLLKPELSSNKLLVRGLYSDFDRQKMLANCPNIIKVYSFEQDGQYVFMTMEYLTGKTLGDVIVRGQGMSMAQAWPIIEGIGNALVYAHEHDLVHRDIKPGNVIITDAGEVKVLDFGIASKINENEDDKTKFGGHMLGGLTVAYAAPEMQRDYPPDQRDDIYSFACVIYEMLTGKQFYRQSSKAREEPIVGLTSRQMEALKKALSLERDKRTETIKELMDKLRPVKKPWAKYLGITTGIALLIAVTVGWYVNERQQQTEVERLAQQQKQEQELLAAKLKAEQEARAEAEKKAKEASIYQGTSRDGIVQLRTSKPSYKNGESFQLSFKLSQPRYVRIIDRDADGQETLLRPNAKQLDELLIADREYFFPPEGVDVPVSGRVGSSSTVTIITSAKGFPDDIKLLKADGSVTEAIQSGEYSWTQIHYTFN